jgi:[protein-PII] uridylyltransferase
MGENRSQALIGSGMPVADLDPEGLKVHYQAQLKLRRADILARHRSGLPSKSVVIALTELADEVITTLSGAVFKRVLDRGLEWDDTSCSLVAVGGYGRKELFPYSDIDLMILYREKSVKAAMSYARGMLMILWDLGFHVGHSVRTVADCLEIGRKDLTTRTSLMEARLLCGSESLFKQFQERFWSGVCRRGTEDYIQAKLEERGREYLRYGSTVHLLEPDIKKSKGGLRDLNLLGWVAAVRHGSARLDDLLEQGLLTQKEYAMAVSAQDFLWKIRAELHFHAGRGQDILSFVEQIRLSKLLSYPDDPHLLGVEKFMREYYRHSTAAHDISTRFIDRTVSRPVWQRIVQRLTERTVEGFFKINQYDISVDEFQIDEFFKDPSHILMLFRLSQQYQVRITRKTQVLLHDHAHRVPEGQWNMPATHRLFLAILSHPGKISRILKQMHQENLLEKVILEFEHVHHLMQFNEYHKYTIDEHCIRAVGLAESLLNEEGELGSVYREVKRKEILHLALLLHDIGKGREGDHSLIGEQIARNVATCLGLTSHDQSLLTFLVRDHLLMAHTAFRRDLSDEGVLLKFARRVAQPEALKMFYIFTYADIAAVGPETWTPWKRELLTELFLRTLEVLTGTGEVLTLEERSERVRQMVRKQLDGTFSAHWLDRQIDTMTPRYLLSTPVDKISKHLQKMQLLPDEKAMVDVEYHQGHGTIEYTVYTYDNLIPGIFSKIAGVLAVKGLQILGAQIHTRRDGVVVDTFQVTDPDYVGIPPPHRFEEVSKEVKRVLLGEVVVDDLFSSTSRFPLNRVLPPRFEATRIEIDNDLSDQYTIIDVFAHDRQGLLYIITKTMFELGLSIHFAKVATRLDQIVDVFYATDMDGRKIEFPETLQSIRQSLVSRIDEFLMSPQEVSGTSSA